MQQAKRAGGQFHRPAVGEPPEAGGGRTARNPGAPAKGWGGHRWYCDEQAQRAEFNTNGGGGARNGSPGHGFIVTRRDARPGHPILGWGEPLPGVDFAVGRAAARRGASQPRHTAGANFAPLY